jgi:hypothetical protein
MWRTGTRRTSRRFVTRDTTWLGWALGAGIVAGACMAAPSETNAQDGSVANDTLGIVKQLIDSRPFTPEKVLRATGIRLDPSDQHRYFSIFKSGESGRGVVRDAELRVPGEGATAGEFLILTLAPGGRVDERQVRKTFGQEQNVSFPTPHQPAGSPWYLEYQMPWGKVSFGFRPAGNRELITIVMDATPR